MKKFFKKLTIVGLLITIFTPVTPTLASTPNTVVEMSLYVDEHTTITILDANGNDITKQRDDVAKEIMEDNAPDVIYTENTNSIAGRFPLREAFVRHQARQRFFLDANGWGNLYNVVYIQVWVRHSLSGGNRTSQRTRVTWRTRYYLHTWHWVIN